VEKREELRERAEHALTALQSLVQKIRELEMRSPPRTYAGVVESIAAFLADGRTPAQDDELLHTVHASAHHWRFAGGTPANLARAENQCARVYAALSRGEAAVHHATRCLELVEAGGEDFEDWDLASALEVTARAHLAAGDLARAEEFAARSRKALDQIADPDDRAVIADQLAELHLPG